jgi:hypothetical protein
VLLSQSDFYTFAGNNEIAMTDTIRVKDKIFSVFIEGKTIDSAIQRVADKINIDINVRVIF